MAVLTPAYERFVRRLNVLEDIFRNWVAAAPKRPSDTDLMFLEGLVSTLWQHWSLFCRRIVFSSALGCISRSGNKITACVAPATWERVSYISWRVHSGGSIRAGSMNTTLRREPTWGDVQKIQNVIAVLSPANAQQLISCFGSVSRGPIDVHRVRNAAAHRNVQSLAEVKALRIYYNGTKIFHPIEVTTWTEPASQDFAFIAWIDEIRLLADLMTQ